MDLETASAIESLRTDLDRATTDLADRILAVETSLGRQLATTENTLRAEMRQLREEVTRDLRTEMRLLREEVTRNAAVLTESVRDNVRIVADGLAAVSAQLVAVSTKIDALKR
jgi:cell division protein FtsB